MTRKTDSKEIFESLPVSKALKAMAIPTVVGQIIVLIYNLADTFYVGQTNNPYMVAGTSLILPVFNITLSLAGLTGVGGGSLISRLLGENREDEAKKVSSFCIYLSIAITALFSIVMAIFMDPILKLLGAGDDTYLYAKQYAFCVIVLGGIPTVLSNVLSNLLRSVGVSKQAGFGITMGGLINIVLDPLFMFVILPKGNEILGVGIATCLSNCIACIYFFCVIYRIRKNSVIGFSVKAGMPERKSISSIFNVGIPSAIATLLFDLDYIIVDKLMVAYGDISLAAIGIVLKAERLPLNVGIGLCQGMMPIVSYNYSSKNYKRMNDTIKCSRTVGLITAAISIILYEILAMFIMKLFIKDIQTVSLGTDFLRIRILATPLMFMSFFTVYLFQAFGKGNKALFLGIMRWMVFNIPMLFILNKAIGMYGIVWSQIAADILTVALSLYVYRRYKKSMDDNKATE
ncbi:MAG: MATE family efflux transporter [Faecalibacterium sp.]|nr:MATE family efflux transporter [Ruminococcus sp.]MCM1391327.1 MATE family efflux transporter [Ruminococcus sp.]MCM1484886.1 MATE family efflux transporter [Faecalibacterium sp.]